MSIKGAEIHVFALPQIERRFSLTDLEWSIFQDAVFEALQAGV